MWIKHDSPVRFKKNVEEQIFKGPYLDIEWFLKF